MNKKIKLILSGSGSLYPAFCGGIIRLAEAGYSFDEILATSGGACVAAAVCSGYQPNSELIKMVKKTLPGPNNLIDRSFLSIFTKWGFIKGDKIEKEMDKYLVKYFKDVKIPLHVVACDLERRDIRVFNKENTPDMRISTAVRASISIPGVFTPVRINDELFVDGGLTGNFLMDYFGPDANVIGIRFTSSRGKYAKIKTPFEYVSAVFDTMIEANTAEHVEDAHGGKVITIDSKFNGLNFNITEADAMQMIAEGYEAADKFVKANETAA